MYISILNNCYYCILVHIYINANVSRDYTPNENVGGVLDVFISISLRWVSQKTISEVSFRENYFQETCFVF